MYNRRSTLPHAHWLPQLPLAHTRDLECEVRAKTFKHGYFRYGCISCAGVRAGGAERRYLQRYHCRQRYVTVKLTEPTAIVSHQLPWRQILICSSYVVCFQEPRSGVRTNSSPQNLEFLSATAGPGSQSACRSLILSRFSATERYSGCHSKDGG